MPKKSGSLFSCSVCDSEFYVPKWWQDKGGGKYCSRECGNIGKKGKHSSWNKGKKMPFAHRKMRPGFMPVRAFKKGQVPWNKGKSSPKIRDENNRNWVGDSVGYDGIHDWVRVRLGKPSKCEMCGTTENRTYHWANKSGQYKRDLSDWIRLCVPCHKRHDDSAKKAWVTRKKNATTGTVKKLSHPRQYKGSFRTRIIQGDGEQ